MPGQPRTKTVDDAKKELYKVAEELGNPNLVSKYDVIEHLGVSDDGKDIVDGVNIVHKKTGADIAFFISGPRRASYGALEGLYELLPGEEEMRDELREETDDQIVGNLSLKKAIELCEAEARGDMDTFKKLLKRR